MDEIESRGSIILTYVGVEEKGNILLIEKSYVFFLRCRKDVFTSLYSKNSIHTVIVKTSKGNFEKMLAVPLYYGF